MSVTTGATTLVAGVTTGLSDENNALAGDTVQRTLDAVRRAQ